MIFNIDSGAGIPLIGNIAFGIIDRGTNLLQVRATSSCNLKCPFCSTNANNLEMHPVDFRVEKDYLLAYVRKTIGLKELDDCEIHLDSVGETLTYPKIVELVKDISDIKQVRVISMQTNGTLLTKGLIDKFESYDLSRINLSMNSFDENQAKFLSGSKRYSIKKIIEMAEYISKSKIKLLIAPVWIPKVNDKDIIELIKFAKSINALIGIQKYEIYKYSRKVRGVKKRNFYKFYKTLEEWEKKLDIKLRYRSGDFGNYKTKRLDTPFKKNQKVSVVIKAPGWIKNQVIGVNGNRNITIDNYKAPISSRVNIKIVENKNNIYLAKKI